MLILLGSRVGSSFGILAIVLGALRWMAIARLVRASFLALKAQPFVEAARAVGAPHRAIVFRHPLRNSAGPIIVAAPLNTASAVVAESALSFLGLGLRPPTAGW